VKKTAGFWDELPAVLERVARLSQIKTRLDRNQRPDARHRRAILRPGGGLQRRWEDGVRVAGLPDRCWAGIPEELVGRMWTEIVAAEDRDALLAMLAAQQIRVLPSRHGAMLPPGWVHCLGGGARRAARSQFFPPSR
jgi:hypothetical protein